MLELVEPLIDENGVELIDLEIKGTARTPLIRVFVDVPGGIKIGECVRLSRLIEEAIDIENLIPGNYRLEVSSPGIDRPLKTPRDFERNIGRLVEIRYALSEDESRVERGDIVAVQEGAVVILTEKKQSRTIPIDRIQKALLQIKW